VDLSKLIEGIKEFFLEILGFLLPGVILLFLLSFFVNSDQTKLFSNFVKSNHWIILMFGYILGYIIYGMALTRDKFLNKLFNIFEKKTEVEIIKENITKSKEVGITKEIFNNLIGKKLEQKDKIDSLSFNGMRSLAMSYTPEADKKIYTFMFRADLCNHLNIVAVLIGISGLLNSIICCLGIRIPLFYTESKYVICYSLLLMISYFLNLTRNRFLAIAFKIPFSIFIAKFYNLDEPETQNGKT
jgi:hypothetical protein